MSMFKRLATGCVVGSFTLLSASAGAQTGAPGQAGQAGTTAQSPNEQRDTRGHADQKFLKKAAIANLAEIELGKLAQQKAQNPEVKQFAQMMVEGHTKALDGLKQAAQGSSFDLPATLDEKHQGLQQRLSGLSGEEFDREYMEAMIDAHEDVKDLLEDRVGEEGGVAAGSGTATGTSGTTGGTSGATGGSGTSGGTTGATGGTATGTTDVGRGSERGMSSNPAIDAWAQKTLPNVRTHLQQAKEIKDRIDK